MLLSPSDVQEIGLKIMGVRNGRKNVKTLLRSFHMHFGSSPLDIADMWYDLCYWDETVLSENEKSEKGFKRLLSAHYWLWCRPKNTELFASRFGMCEDYCRGSELWKWIGRIAGLAKKKIKWDKKLDMKDTEVFGITADGMDHKMWERQDAEFPYDPKNMSHKFRACAAKYLIALSVYEPKCVLIAGPYRGGLGDLDIFRECGLLKKLQKSQKICIADRGFRSRNPKERETFAYPDYIDSKELHNFKSRARLRHETYNRRLKHLSSLSETWKNGFEKHGIALRAVAVIVQYQMDNGSPIFAV